MYKPLYDAKASALFFADGETSSKNLPIGKINVFVCGALQNPDKMHSLIGRSAAFAPAAVSGFRRVTKAVAGKLVPFMVPSKSDHAKILTGVVWLDLTDKELTKIESLELDGDLRKRIRLNVRAGERRVEAYTYIKK